MLGREIDVCGMLDQKVEGAKPGHGIGSEFGQSCLTHVVCSRTATVTLCALATR